MSAQEVKKANRLKSTVLIKPVFEQYWQDVYNAKKEGKLVCYETGAPITPIFEAQGMIMVHGEGYAAVVAGRHEETAPQSMAERRGFNREVCSYARTHIGCSYFANDGVPSDIKAGLFSRNMPKPDLIVTNYAGCSSGPQWDWCIARMGGKKVPWFNMSYPFLQGRNGASYMKGQEYEDAVAYVHDQFKKLIRFLEEVSGRPYNWDALREKMAYVKKVCTTRMEALRLCQAKPCPASFFDWGILLAPVNYLLGRPGTLEIMEAVKAEIQDRISNHVGAVQNEKYRLFWDGLVNWNKVGWLANKFADFDACVVAARYTHDAFIAEPELVDPEDPLPGLAANCLAGFFINHGYPIAEERIFKLCRDYSVDGVILHAMRTCRSFARQQLLISEGLQRKMNISSTMIEGDMVDESFYQDESVNTRIEALLESLDAQKSRG